jgi:hypothetical protein
MADKTTQETRVRIAITYSDGKIEKTVLEESDAEAYLKEASADPKVTNAEVQASQSYLFHEVSDEDPITDFLALVPTVSEQANIVNRAIVLKQQQFVRKQLLSDTFVPVDGAFDLREVCGQVSERQKASPEQKAANALSKMLGRPVTIEDLAAIVASLGAPASA